MTVSVTLPSLWRSLLGCREVHIDPEGEALREIIQQLLGSFPDLRSEMVDGQGNLLDHLLFFLNDQNAAALGGMEAPVRDGDRIVILLAAAGGAAAAARRGPGRGGTEPMLTERRLLP